MTTQPILLLLFFLVTKSAASQADTVYWPTGEIKLVLSNENGHTYSTSFHKNGNIHEKGTLRDGEKMGEWRKYYPSGKIERITAYVQGDYAFSYVS